MGPPQHLPATPCQVGLTTQWSEPCSTGSRTPMERPRYPLLHKPDQPEPCPTVLPSPAQPLLPALPNFLGLCSLVASPWNALPSLPTPTFWQM